MTSSNQVNDSGAEPSVAPPGSVQRTIYIECTHTYHSDINTGIQRVVRNVLRNAPAIAAKYNMRVVPIVVENSRFRAVDAEPVLRDKQAKWSNTGASGNTAISRWSIGIRLYVRSVLRAILAPFPNAFYWYLRSVLNAILPFASVRRFLSAPRSEFGLTRMLCTPLRVLHRISAVPTSPSSHKTSNASDQLLPQPGSDYGRDILLLLDSSWSAPIWNATHAFKKQGVTVIGVIYDLIPITHPHACVQELTTAFTGWLREYCRVTDGTVTISKFVKLQFEGYTRLCFPATWSGVRSPIRHFYLGSELDLASEKSASLRLTNLYDKKMPTFLVVGSIEPRKNHAYVLDAFDKLWAADYHVRLVIIGKQAWRTEDFLQRAESHPRLHENLFVLRDASDGELEQCYRSSDALVIASEVEGFGLPIVEAFQRALPVLCSDIPVFREVGGDSVTYFSLDDPQMLTNAVISFLKNQVQAPQHRANEWMTWHQSTAALFAAIGDIAVAHTSTAPSDDNEATTDTNMRGSIS